SSRIMKITQTLWAAIRIILVISIVFFLLQIYTFLHDYWEYRTWMEVRLRDYLSHFPAVTLCTVDSAKYAIMSNGTRDELSSNEFTERGNISIDDFLLSCTFKGDDCDIPNDFQRIGNGGCFSFNFNFSKIRISHQFARRSGLRLHLNTPKGGGARIVVHAQGVIPLPHRFGHDAPAGFATTIGFRAKDIRRLDAPFGICRDDDIPALGSRYSQEVCFIDCAQYYLQRACGCIDPRYPYQTGRSRACDPTEDVERWSCMEEELKRLKSIAWTHDCHCPPQCAETVYQTSYSTSVLPFTVSNCSSVMNNSNKCTQFDSSSTAIVEVFLEQAHYEALYETAVFPLPRLLSDIIRNIILCLLIVVIIILTRRRNGEKKTNITVEMEERTTLNMD
ncbi:hypothetical protein PENTCL1PPCAC_305, partial [Pristionchus entomophagus]